MNELMQWVAVGIAIIMIIVWVVRKYNNRSTDNCDDGCGDCPLVNNCKTKSKKQ